MKQKTSVPRTDLLDVLLVDDERQVLNLAKELLEMHGPFKVEMALSVDEAFCRLGMKEFSAIISDYAMPAKDGLEFLRELRLNGSNIPFIFFSGKGEQEIAAKASGLVADEYVWKSGSPEDVYSRLACCIVHAVEERGVHNSTHGIAIDERALDPAGVNEHSSNAVTENESSHLSEAAREFNTRLKEDLSDAHPMAEEAQFSPQKVNTGVQSAQPDSYDLEVRKLLEGISRNVAERRRAEKALLQSQERFRNIVETVKDWIWEIDAEGRFTYASPRLRDILGYEPDEILGKKFFDIMPPEEAKRVDDAFRGSLEDEGPVVSLEKTVIHKDGHLIVLETNFVPFFDQEGNPMGFRGVDRNVTERKKVERAIMESREKFEGLFRSNPEAACYLDSEFRVIDINPKFKDLFGYSLDEIKGMKISDLIVPKDMIGEGETLDQKIRMGHLYFDTVRKTKGGRLVAVSISAAPLTLGEKVASYTAIYKDITKLKDAEEKLKELNEKLRVVGVLTRHDVRNKLSVLMGYSYTLRKKLAGNDEALKRLREVEYSSQQIMNILKFASNYEKVGGNN
ncbi:hypothetical protein A3K70_00960 [Candidatus Bathyarchaeota archaeon RBG_16_48_13]|nr:MAG: hypothetical protein A3K70_00960 [Candidatus Bathyarchaeota archaeon RBG_16_48_13]